MTDPADSGDRGHERMPRWVVVFAVIGAGVALLAVVSLLTGGEHGPGRHGRGGDPHPRTGTGTGTAPR